MPGHIAALAHLLHKAGHGDENHIFVGGWVVREKRREYNLHDAPYQERRYFLIILRLRRCAGFFASCKFLCRP